MSKFYNKKLKGLLLLLGGFIFGILETKYFGSNYWPESIAELICDAISTTVSCFGIYFILSKTPQP